MVEKRGRWREGEKEGGGGDRRKKKRRWKLRTEKRRERERRGEKERERANTTKKINSRLGEGRTELKAPICPALCSFEQLYSFGKKWKFPYSERISPNCAPAYIFDA